MYKYSLGLTTILLMCSVLVFGQGDDQITYQRETHYGSPNDPSLPEWTKMMYSTDPNVGEVVKAYEAFYKANPFVKNEHTQYYKRWLRNTKEVVNSQGFIRPPSKAEKDRMDKERLRARTENTGSRSMAIAPNWLPIGPFDFDKDAAGRSHAPGAAHVYTIEKAPSNPDILYCGTANAGVWKTINRGMNWTYASATLPVNHCNAVEIHPTDPNTVWIGANSRVYKTTNGGTAWSQVGDVAFNALSHSIDDIALQPGTTDVLFVASNKGLYKSIDGGSNFVKLLSPKGNNSYFGEIEFKPNDPNTVYALLNEANGVYAELYKSTDGGTTFTIVSAWPTLASSANGSYQYVGKTSSTSQHASFTNDNLGTATIPDFTIEMRVKFPSSNSNKSFLSNKNWASGLNNGWLIGSQTNGELTFNIGNGTQRIDLNTASIWDDQWHQVSVVYRTAGQKELYVDGLLKATSTANITAGVNSGFPMVMGKDGNLGFGVAAMQVDEVRIWNTALSRSNMDPWFAIEVNNTHPNYANLLHYYKCNEASGTTLLDVIGTNNGTLTGTWTRSSSSSFLTSTNLPNGDHQRRGEIAVTAANPEKIYALLAGSAYGGSGLFGFYESVNAGASWTHKCCGSGPGGTASTTNPNILGYSSTGNENGGQYYYDLALDADPNNANKVHIAGINPWISLNSGTTFTNVGHWSNPAGVGYVHADVHNIKIYGNEVWTVSDGGVFMSQDSGKVTFNRRQFGISGTDFWGFGMGHKDGDVMLGGTYHNSHLMKNNNVYLNGWISYTGSADGTRGFVNPGKDKVVYNDGEKQLLPPIRTQNPQGFTFAHRPNTDPVSKIIWDPRCYNCLYSGKDTLLWYSPDDGTSWQVIRNFAPYYVGDIEVAWDNPNIIYVSVAAGFYDPKKIWRTLDKGITWTDVTPSSSTLGYNSDMWYNITLGDNSQHVWMNVYHRYGWNSGNNNKIFYSSNGGTSWTNISSAVLNGQNIDDVTFQRGSNGGIYVGTNKSVYYKDHSLSAFVPFAAGLPQSISTTRLPIWYKEGKIRLASNQSVWESPLYTIAPPTAQPMVDKLSSDCARDTFYFGDYSAQYKTGASYLWTITPAPEYMSSASVDRPKVVFGSAGLYNVSLTVTDSVGTSTKALLGGISISNSGCGLDTIPGKTMLSVANGQYGVQEKAMNISSNTITLSAWIKPSGLPSDIAGLIFCRGTNTLASGLHLTNTNELRYHWLDGQYGFGSGLIVPTNQWSHVALVITPSQARLYLNGVEAVHNTTLPVANFLHPFHIGLDPSTTNRTFKGRMDEVAIYNRSLTKAEIRELMHLTKNPISDAALKAYYQFNFDSSVKDYDKVGNNHLLLTSGTSKVESTAPVGKGVSQTIGVTTGGLKNFATPGIKMYFKTSGATYPAGDIVVTRINQLPDTFPVGGILPKAYWAINNYGTNQTFTVLDSMTFVNSGNVAGGCTPRMYEMYRRAFNGEGVTWGTYQDQAERFNPNPLSEVVFKADNNVTTFGQFHIRNNNIASNDLEICNGIDDNCNGLIDESYSLTVTSTADSGVNSLRQILTCAQDGDVILFAANVDTITLLSPLVISKDVTLQDQIGNKVALKMNLNAAGFANAQAGITFTNTASASIENMAFVHTNNTVSKPAILNHGNLIMSSSVLIGNPKTVILNSPTSSYLVKGIVEVK